MVNCKICSDTGFVIYKKMVNGYEYDYAAHCVCNKGNNYKYDGTQVQNEKNKSDYYVASIRDIDLNQCDFSNSFYK